MTSTFRFLPFAFGLAFTGVVAVPAADLFYDGRLVDGAGSPRAGISLQVTPRLYGAATGGTALSTLSDVTISTDTNGGFSVTFTDVTLPDSSTGLWLGLTPSGESEDLPRLHLGAAPLAVHAKSVSGVNSAEEIALTNLAFTTLSASLVQVSGNADINHQLILQGATIDGFSSFNFGELDLLPGSAISMLRPAGITGMTQKYDSFAGDSSLYADGNDSTEKNISAAGDGIVIVAAKSDHSGGQSKFYFTMKVGDVTVSDGRNLITDDDSNALIFTMPVRKGENVYLKAKCAKSGLYWRKAFIKYRFVYFGAN